MSDSPDPSVEGAKAIQEAAKATSNAIDAAREVGGFVAKYIDGPLEQGIGIFVDKLRYMRWERQVRLMRRAGELLASAGLAAPSRTVPMKIAIPVFQAASIEENDELQDCWAALLVNAANAQSGIEVERSFIAILEQLSSLEVRILDLIYSLPLDESLAHSVWIADLPNSARVQSKADEEKTHAGFRAELANEIKIALGNLDRQGCIKLPFTWAGGESFIHATPTSLGAAFVQACRVRTTGSNGHGNIASD